MSLIYIPTGYSNVSSLDTSTFKVNGIKNSYISVSIATEEGSLTDYAGNTQQINVGDIIFTSDNKISVISTLNDFITNVVSKEDEPISAPATTELPLTITLTGTATPSKS
jgi:hypothetical protein